MIPIFIDTSFFLALLNSDDAAHPAAMTVQIRIEQEMRNLVTSGYILCEMADALCGISDRSRICRVFSLLLHDVNVNIEPCNNSLFAEALDLYCSRPDKTWSMTDCTSFCIMQRRNIQDVLTLDRHFSQAGFTRMEGF
jgi:hypothetical protein